MADGTKRPRTTAPPVQGGGFVTAGDDAWTQQDPDTWAKMGTPNATPHRPAAERRNENGGAKDVPRATISARPAPRAVIGASPSRPPTSAAELGRLLEGAKSGDDPSTVVGAALKTKPPGGPKPGVSRIDGARMEIVNFDGVGSRVGGAAAIADEPPQAPLTRWDRMFPGHPPIRIVRRARKEAAVGRVALSVAVIVALAAFAWDRYDRYLESQVSTGNKVIFTTAKTEAPAEGAGSGSGAPAADAGVAPWGTLTVRSNRAATVYVDGRSAGWAPLETVRIVKGTHEVKLVDEKTLESRTQMVEIVAGQPKNITLSF